MVNYNSDRGENFKIIICCYIDINVVKNNESISKWPHLFKLSDPLWRYRNSKLRFDYFLKQYRDNIRNRKK